MFEIPFNSTDKFQANVHLFRDKYFIYLKGAPERVLEHCSTVAFGNETKVLNEETKAEFTESCYVLANNGERVFGFADLELSSKTFPVGYHFETDPLNFPLENLRLVSQFYFSKFIITQTINSLS